MVCTIVSDKLEVNFIYKKHTQDIKKKITEMVWKMYCKGYDTFQVNCEYGIPLWTAEIITALKMYTLYFLIFLYRMKSNAKIGPKINATDIMSATKMPILLRL